MAAHEFVVAGLQASPSVRFGGESPRNCQLLDGIDWWGVESRSAASPVVPDPSTDVNPRVCGPCVTSGQPDDTLMQGTQSTLASTMSFASTSRGNQTHSSISTSDAQRKLIKKSDSVLAMTYVEGQVELTMLGSVQAQMRPMEQAYTERVVISARGQPGFKGTRILKDEVSGIVCIVTTWSDVVCRENVMTNGWWDQMIDVMRPHMCEIATRDF